MNTETIHLKSYFGFAKMPFTKYMWASKMFEASSQKEFLAGAQPVAGNPGHRAFMRTARRRQKHYLKTL